MNTSVITRRNFMRISALVGASLVGGGLLAACSSNGPAATGTTGG